MRTLERERQTVPAWRALVRGAAVVDFLLLAGTAVALTDVEAGGFAVVTLALIGLLHVRKGEDRDRSPRPPLRGRDLLDGRRCDRQPAPR